MCNYNTIGGQRSATRIVLPPIYHSQVNNGDVCGSSPIDKKVNYSSTLKNAPSTFSSPFKTTQKYE
jgi:hypothetical protein